MDRAVQRFTDRSREMRRASTDAERLLWGILRNRRFLGLKFRRQHEIEERFIVDFYCPELHLAIELDGRLTSRSRFSNTMRSAAEL